MATNKAQKAWLDRKKLGEQVAVCAVCNKKLRAESKAICQSCWKQTSEGKAYNQYQVAKALEKKIDKIAQSKIVANHYKNELGFVNSAALEESDAKGCLQVISDVGFVHFHHRKDKQTTIYSLAVLPGKTGYGWGRLLFYKVLCSAIANKCTKILAKCPIDLVSNQFYRQLGFNLSKVEEGKNRQLNCWVYNIELPLLFYCADGGRNKYGQIAQEEGWMLGFQSAQTDPYYHVQMIDNRYRDYNHKRHVEMIKKHKPLIATAQDIENMQDLPRILKEARELSMYCGQVLLIPKIKCWLPSDYWLAFSVPTSHGATDVEPSWFGDREVHLLGGSPNQQAHYAKMMNVISLDGNYAMGRAAHGLSTWQGVEEKIQNLSNDYGCYPAFELSMKMQKKYWHSHIKTFEDLPLFTVPVK